MSKKLLIINKTQFGYHTDSYKYCEHLKDKFNITYIGFDSGNKKLNVEGIYVKYVSNRGSLVIRGLRFLILSFLYSLFFRGVIFLIHFHGCKPFRLLIPFKKIILDIRTLSISKNKGSREIYDKEIKQDCKYFKYITAISEGVSNKLNINQSKVTILPLGSDIISDKNKKFEKLSLLYVGTLSGRDLAKTVEGVKIFLENNPNQSLVYNIIGIGDDFELIQKRINDWGLCNNIKMHGRIPHFELEPYFENSNIGISFVPIVDYYDYQPPTKTFEYTLSGLFCIATDTIANREVITQDNGMLILDTPNDFARALETISNNKHNFDSVKIRKSMVNFQWKKIIDNKLQPILSSI
jgi:glycosyltransferase involved in cell wall biosynthesis